MYFPLLLTVLLAVPTTQADDTKPADVSRASQFIVEQTNAFRVENKLGKLKSNEALAKAATEFAQFMARTGKYGHEADGRKPTQRAEAAGYAWGELLENIAMEYNSEGFATGELGEKFVTGWKNSPGHRKNMLNGDVTEIGVGAARSEDGHYYAVQMFGRPESANIKFSIENKTRTAVKYKLADREFTLEPGVTRTHTISGSAQIQLTDGTGAKVDAENGAKYVFRAKPNDAIKLVKEQ